MAATLLSTRPGQGKDGGECVAYAGAKCFGILFGANTAKDIWKNHVTNTGAALPYTKHNTMPALPCCIVWGNGTNGHVGVIESKSGGSYRFSDSNRSPLPPARLVNIITTGLAEEDDVKNIIGKTSFLGYVKFK